jgi:alkylation response protein AidB-like acyl-CoA dehydrogenase
MPMVDAFRELLPRIRSAAADTEMSRRAAPALIDELAHAGAFRMLVPKAYGGAQATPSEMVRAIEEISRACASTGWCVMVGALSGLLAAYADDALAREIFEKRPNVILSGVFAPTGHAVELPDGRLRVRGRWAFASGCEHASYRMGGVLMMSDGKPVMRAEGEPDVRHVIFDANDAKVVDTWDVAGLCGTGSHDMLVEDVVVPAARAVRFTTAPAREKGALYTFPPIGLLALGVASVCLGIAREAIAELVAVAGAKHPGGGRRSLAERETVQVQVGEAEALVASSRAYVLSTADEIFAKASGGAVVEDADRARLRLAATHATRACARAVDLMYEAGGGTSIYKKNALQRHFRDLHVATQHAMVASSTYSIAGRLALGQRVDRTTL